MTYPKGVMIHEIGVVGACTHARVSGPRDDGGCGSPIGHISSHDFCVSAPTKVLHGRPYRRSAYGGRVPDRTIVAQVVIEGDASPCFIQYGNAEVNVQIADIDRVESEIVEGSIVIGSRRDLRRRC